MLCKRSFQGLRQPGFQTLSRRFLSITHEDPKPGTTSANIVDQELGNIVGVYARYPLVMSHGQGSFLFDKEGRKFIDFTSGVAVTSLGHSHPEVARLAADQCTKLVHSSNLYFNEPAIELAHKINTSLSQNSKISSPSKIFFSNSGTEANETALKFARKAAYETHGEKKTQIVYFNNSFHGRSLGSLSITANPKYRRGFEPLLPDVVQATYNDIESIKQVINDKTAAVIVEPVQGEGGICPANAEFLVALRKACDKFNASLIYDEIQCGLGRSGDFWAHSVVKDQASPDIITVAKPLANGLPISATIVSSKVAETLHAGEHGSTFGGNPVACRVGSFCVDELSSSKILNNVRKQHNTLTSRFAEFTTKYPSLIRGYAGRGLLLGLQFKQSPADFINIARQQGLLLLPGGNNNTRVLPSLNVEDSVIADGLDIMDDALKHLSK
ncbi:acetylornithine aminotransferase [Schizosaccharomyces cryophilus OY26]|uniref:acetylornithine transaminase n=1 Tax=Schizosaccharomyces cryophilus (strain OY26 / ATCC MYA-4695 / CBS 11777 / NBRC 106824 / NRRL Y48691) TaxID=653667 RepID=S9X2N9_SCHCR|nr:acetylornithine aminotransferase [Schizosaccharomyces cryophilus OY26]EPY51347.1 acetylornithine aminotransferase [Schizosaccharomyces cryophilus OY26]